MAYVRLNRQREQNAASMASHSDGAKGVGLVRPGVDEHAPVCTAYDTRHQQPSAMLAGNTSSASRDEDPAFVSIVATRVSVF